LPIYTRILLTLFANLQGEKPTAEMLDFPNVTDGVRMAFIESVIASKTDKMV
jgi:hypothetical protein